MTQPSASSIDNTQPFLQRIQNEFPDLEFETFSHLSHGWDHDVVILDDTLVFRFPNSREYSGLLKDEIGLLDYLGTKSDVKIPRYTYIASDYSFAGYGIIQGDELTEANFSELSSADKSQLAGQLAKFFTAIHGVPLADAESFSVSREKPIEYDLRQLVEQYLEPNMDPDELEQVNQVIAEVEDKTTQQLPETLTHGDISPKHIIWNATEKSVGLIDFSDRCIGDPAFDFAELYLYGAPFVEQVYDLYQGPHDPEFLDRAKAYLRRVGVYLMADSFRTQKITFEEAKRIFDVAMQL